MNRSHRLAVVLAFVAGPLGAIAAPGLKDGKDDKSDLKKLEGDWTIESWVQIGQTVPMDATWNFKGDKYTLNMGANLEEGSITIDQSKKPSIMDLTITGGTCKGKDQPGIYKFDGDSLICCFAWPGTTDRPTDFTSTTDNRYILITLKRTK
jgi:uncharacterized protein (TIGR03067 family)